MEMSIGFADILRKLNGYIDLSSEMQAYAVEYAYLNGGIVKLKNFCKKYHLRYKQALELFRRLERRGLFKKTGLGTFEVTEKGREICDLISSINLNIDTTTIKAVMLIGLNDSSNVPLDKLSKSLKMESEDVLKILNGWVSLKSYEDGRKIVELNENGRKMFQSILGVVGLGKQTMKLLSMLTFTKNPASALKRFIALYVGSSIIVLYDVFSMPLLGSPVAILWLFITLLLLGYLLYEK